MLLAVRDVSKEYNSIRLYIPVHVVNMEDLSTPVNRLLSFTAVIGHDETVWSSTSEVMILDAATTPPVPDDTVEVKSVELSPSTPSPIKAGGAAVFLASVTVAAGWADFDILVTGDVSSGRSFINCTRTIVLLYTAAVVD